jgi:hypothetical protein
MLLDGLAGVRRCHRILAQETNGPAVSLLWIGSVMLLLRVFSHHVVWQNDAQKTAGVSFNPVLSQKNLGSVPELG